MCGRFGLVITEDFYNEFKVNIHVTFENFDIRPTTLAPIITYGQQHNDLKLAEWSMIPKELGSPLKFPTFNARSETLEEKRTFAKPYRETRCLVPMSCYYEWHLEQSNKGKDKYNISVQRHKYFAVAGLYRVVNVDGKGLTCFTVITAPAHPSIKYIHDRMPVIVAKEDRDIWLNPEARHDEVEAIIRHPEEQRYKIFKEEPATIKV